MESSSFAYRTSGSIAGLSPSRMKSAFRFNAAIGMGAEIVPLGLDEAGWLILR
jgi:hypothetical protein